MPLRSRHRRVSQAPPEHATNNATNNGYNVFPMLFGWNGVAVWLKWQSDFGEMAMPFGWNGKAESAIPPIAMALCEKKNASEDGVVSGKNRKFAPNNETTHITKEQ